MRIKFAQIFLGTATLLLYTSAHATLTTVTSGSFQVGPFNWRDGNYETGHSLTQYAAGPASAIASADATYGSVKARGIAQSTGGGNISVGASAGFKDRLILDRTGMTGAETSTITVAYYIDYNASYDVSGPGAGSSYSNGSVVFDALLGNLHGSVIDYGQVGTNNPSFYYSIDNRGKITDRPNGPSWIYLTTNFRWGDAIDFGLGVQLDGSAYSPDPNTSIGYIVDAAHSGYWGGITDVTVDGVHINDYVLRSSSGIDYSKSFAPTTSTKEVPEPHILLLSLVGFTALFGVRKNGKRYDTAGNSSLQD